MRIATRQGAWYAYGMAVHRLKTFRPQRRNANRHTPRGMDALAASIQQDGWIGAMTVAADGEVFDGSARLAIGMQQDGAAEAIVVESDGSRPIIVKRVDIPSADDPRAKRLGLAANRVAQLNLHFDPEILRAIHTETALTPLWTTEEFTAVVAPPDSVPALPLPASPLPEPPRSDATAPAVHPSLLPRYPLSIVLTTAQKREWDDYKAVLGVASDVQAFLTLFARRTMS